MIDELELDGRVLSDGERFAFGTPDEAVPIWGEPTAPLWAAGEGLMIAAPEGVGKTTVAQQLVLARLGLRDGFLGFNVVPGEGRVLYLALDRPRQIARSLKRMVSDDDREVLRRRLIVWKGPLEQDMGGEFSDPRYLAALAEKCGASTLVIDSLKDAAVKLSADEVGSRVNAAFQHVLAADIELVALHHPKKAQDTNRKPNKLSDIYGSRWLTAGMGSVLSIWGDAGDLIVDLTHLKQPLEPVGPLTLIHEHQHGRTTVEAKPTIQELVTATRRSGISPKEAAHQVYGSESRSAVERARRALEKLLAQGFVERRDDTDGTARYYATELPRLEVA